MGSDVRANLPLSALLSTSLSQSAPLAGQAPAHRKHRFSAMFQCIPQMQSSAEAPRTGRFLDRLRSTELWPKMASLSDSILQRKRTQRTFPAQVILNGHEYV